MFNLANKKIISINSFVAAILIIKARALKLELGPFELVSSSVPGRKLGGTRV